MRVAVIRGGRSSEHPVSLRSGAAVAEGLRAAGHETVDVVIEPDGRWVHEGAEVDLRAAAGLLGCDVAFPVLHGPFGEDGTVQGLLECLDLPYVGPGVLAAAVTIDKLIFKRLIRERGIAQVEFCQAGGDGWREAVEALGMPVWVKPSRLGSSVGILKVAEPGGLDAAVATALEHDPRVIVEAHCDGLEVECSVIGNDEPETSLPGQLVIKADWYHYAAKYEPGGMELVVPAPIGDEAVARVRALAADVYSSCGCTGLARCDFFVMDDGEVLVNELNTIPGFTETSVFSKLFEATGIPYPDLCDRLVGLALERHESERSYRF
ncbi:MAG TPA: D-alanine--D-alanine ligase family protein [Solirubrobacterales bacterium]|nr:D-alanine--D-alanine ligase family protein [Solirubrobacterales bacterium]